MIVLIICIGLIALYAGFVIGMRMGENNPDYYDE